jgi:flagellar hook-associated protein 2
VAPALDGLASGLPTADLIRDLMALEAIPQKLLKNKATAASTSVTALQALNAQIASLATLAESTSAPGSLDFYTATSSTAKATATATTGAAAGSIDIVVDRLAQAQTGVSAVMSTWSTPPVLTIAGSDGTLTEITADSSSLEDVVRAVNSSGTGVTATRIAAGTAADGEPKFRLQFSSKATGADAAFAVHRGAKADISAGTDVLAQPGAAVIREAEDASLTLWKGTAAEQVLTSTTNTFADLLPGVSVTVSGVSAEPVTIVVERDTDKASTTAAAIVSALNSAFAFISTRSVSTASTDADGKPIMSGGVFTAESTTRELSSKLLAAASLPVNGRSPSEYGISITKTGTMEFNAERFAAAYASDPAAVQAAVAEISTRIAAVAESASDKTTGTVTARITGQQSTITSLNEQVERWDDRLATRKSNLERMYSAFEVRMSNMNAQMTWLTDQVNSLKAQKD